MSLEENLKHSLLVTHGTIYGTISESPEAYFNFSGMTACFDKQEELHQWIQSLPYSELTEVAINGVLTDNTPIDVIHWVIEGHFDFTGLEWWRQCMTLFMRHV